MPDEYTIKLSLYECVTLERMVRQEIYEIEQKLETVKSGSEELQKMMRSPYEHELKDRKDLLKKIFDSK